MVDKYTVRTETDEKWALEAADVEGGRTFWLASGRASGYAARWLAP